MGKVISVVNQKGGVGKTTTTLNLGHSLGELGKKVLLIDLDPQSSLTVCMGYDDPDTIEFSIASLMNDAMLDKDLPEKEKYIIKGEVDIIPCNMDLSAVDINLVTAMGRENILKDVISNFKEDYDYIIIDCSPSLGMLTVNALVATDSVIIPVTPSYLSAKGLEILIGNILRVKRKLNPNLKIDGILYTMYSDRFNSAKQVKELISTAYEKNIKIYEHMIPRSVQVENATLNNKPIIEFAKHNPVAIAYREFAQEVI